MSDRPTRPVPSIKYFATSWYDRGFAYWRRRCWLTAFALLLALAVSVGISALIVALVDLIASPVGRVGAIAVAAIPVVWSCYSAYLTPRRPPEDRAAHHPMSFAPQNPAHVRVGGAAGVTTGLTATAGSSLAGGLLAVGSLFLVGQALGLLAITLGKYVSEDEWRLARQYGSEELGHLSRGDA
ncbi:hypothetical protein ACLQ3C_02600 [Gordonia sp. DT30]|uniref:hypothetical protein n=1 Tax=unclassified Gordonia (in: high G+C Gram-positive bacteria) TaxID=2657482 RepID=UPI003CEC6FE9